MKRRIFYSFHYKLDNWRAGQIRNIGVIEGNEPATDNDWEEVKMGGDGAIKSWIANQMNGRSCTVVLVGANTAGRKWINHEITKSWNDSMGVVGIHIHGLEDTEGKVSIKGRNLFDIIGFRNSRKDLSSVVKCYTPVGRNGQERYDWISKHLFNVVEQAISIRRKSQLGPVCANG